MIANVKLASSTRAKDAAVERSRAALQLVKADAWRNRKPLAEPELRVDLTRLDMALIGTCAAWFIAVHAMAFAFLFGVRL